MPLRSVIGSLLAQFMETSIIPYPLTPTPAPHFHQTIQSPEFHQLPGLLALMTQYEPLLNLRKLFTAAVKQD